MFKKSLHLILSIFILGACTSEEDKEQIQDILIELNIENNVVITSDEIVITITGESLISKLEVLLDNGMLQNFTSPPYTFTINPANYEDGTHSLNIIVFSDNKKIGSKTITIKIDNTGPQLTLNEISNNELICNEILLTPVIDDVVSDVANVEVYLDDLLLLKTMGQADYTFALIPDQLPVGNSNLKFVMEDAIGNISNDSLNIQIGKKILSLSFPDNFIRENIDRVHVLLSDAEGKFIDRKIHSSGQLETLEFCSFEEFNNDTKFMLSFISDFEESIYSLFVYADLTKNILGDHINLPHRTAGLQPAFIDLDVSFYEDNYYMRASTPWSSMIYSNQTFSGHLSKTHTNEFIGTNKTFIQYYNQFIENDYQYTFIDNLYTKFSLEQADFTRDNVVHGSIAVNGSFQRPFMSIYGFESEAHYDAISGHMLYWNPSLLGNSTGYTYSYANIFDYMVYSFKVKNYTIEGTGIPASSVTVPNANIDYNYTGNEFTFTGLTDYEVGRLRLKGTNSGLITPENPSVGIEFIFNGESTNIKIPEIPEGILPNATKEVFDNNEFEVIQGAAENYSNITEYSEYISKVLVHGKPFYKTSDTRERIFKSSVGTQLLPINEFPFYERF